MYEVVLPSNFNSTSSKGCSREGKESVGLNAGADQANCVMPSLFLPLLDSSRMWFTTLSMLPCTTVITGENSFHPLISTKVIITPKGCGLLLLTQLLILMPKDIK